MNDVRKGMLLKRVEEEGDRRLSKWESMGRGMMGWE